MPARDLYLIPHTHWDREWYEPHDVFRVRLVALVDQLLDLLEADPDYRFTLDGQAAAVDDYLEIRPENAERLTAAVRRGQLAIGPFLILLDEFCCDGETIIRNLELGIRASRRVDQEMRIGYLPDMFGHAAQMPQILRGFGIADAALWRGVPDRIRTDAFRWSAPNGDWVRTEYLWDGYGNALKLFEPSEKAAELITDYLARNAGWFSEGAVAGMYGTDHMFPRPDLSELVDRAARDAPVGISLATLEEVVTGRDHTEAALAVLPEAHGELRSHARGNLLPGVLSIRSRLKAAMAAGERALTTAERLHAVAGTGDAGAFLDLAWYRLVESTAHDSVTGCGVDATAEEVQTRLHIAGHIATGVTRWLASALAARAATGSMLVFNPSGHARRTQVEVEIEGTAAPDGTQLIGTGPTCIGEERLATRDLLRLVRRIHGQELFGRQIRSYSWTADGLDFVVAGTASGGFDLATFSAELEGKVRGSDPAESWRVRTLVAPTVRALVEVVTPGLGVVAVPEQPVREADAPPSVTAQGQVLDNGLLQAEVMADGTVSITDRSTGATLDRALALVDEGDRGDAYNFGPVAEAPLDRPHQVVVGVEEAGPLRGRVRVSRQYLLPTRLGADPTTRSSDQVAQPVDTVLELRRGEPFLRVSVSLVNQAADHRLRLHVPTLAGDVDTTTSAGQYGATVRSRTAEGGWGEFPLPTFPATRFVHAGGVGVLLRQLTEYELVPGSDGGPDELALTLVRAVGRMSVNVHPLRDEPAGAEIPVPGAQYLGTELRAEFAVGLAWPAWEASTIVGDADSFRLDPVTVAGTGTADLPPPAAPLATTGDVALESLRHIPGDPAVLEARLVNYYPQARPLAIVTDRDWDLTDLTGTVLVESVRPDHLVPGGQIVTLRSR